MKTDNYWKTQSTILAKVLLDLLMRVEEVIPNEQETINAWNILDDYTFNKTILEKQMEVT